MSELDTFNPAALSGMAVIDEASGMSYAPPSVQAGAGQVAVNSFGGFVTAQRVAVKRDLIQVQQRLKVLCAMAGQSYVYSWEVEDRQNRRKQTVEGPTIKLANDLAREFGNCVVDVRVEESGDATIFYARFTDLETGFSMTRPFRQRKKPNIGRYENERALDMAFQIGASKAIRNVVVNALSTFAGFMVEESKKAVLTWLSTGDNKDKAWAFIERVAGEQSIELSRVEAVVGRKTKDWTIKDLARVLMEMRGIDDGMTVADEVYPSAADAKEIERERSAKSAMDKIAGDDTPAEGSAAKDDAKPARRPRTAAAPKEDPKPAPEPKEDPKPAAAREPDPEPDLPPHDADTGEIQEDDGPADDDGDSLFGADS